MPDAPEPLDYEGAEKRTPRKPLDSMTLASYIIIGSAVALVFLLAWLYSLVDT